MTAPLAPRSSLRNTLYRSHLTIALGATLLLVVAVGFTQTLRARALHLAASSGPLALSAKTIQANLSRAEVDLRGYMALNEPALRQRSEQAWVEVYAELERLEALRRGDDSSAKIHDSLPRLRGHLLNLQEWHWYIGEVAQTPGNEPARHDLRTRVTPVVVRLEEIVGELIDRRPAAEVFALLARVQAGVLHSAAALEEFVDEGLPSQAGAWERELVAVDRSLEELGRGSSADAAAFAELRQELTAYRFYAKGVAGLRGREDWNVSNHWLANEARVESDAAQELLEQVVNAERARMDQDAAEVVLIARIVPLAMLGLLVLMVVGALIASARAARRITEPVQELAAASLLLASGGLEADIPVRSSDEIGALTEAFNAMRATLLERHRKLQDSQTRLEATFATVVDALITIDDRGTVESMNPAAEALFGVAASVAVGTNIRDYMPEPYKGEHDGYLQRYLETGEPRIIGTGREVIGLRGNGEQFPADLAVNEMWIGGERKFAGLVRDITERKRVERVKTEFVSVVSHELRTPLTSIRGSLGLITGGAVGEIPPGMDSMLQIAVRSTDRLIRLINDILDVEKIQSGKLDLTKRVLMAGVLLEQARQANLGFAEGHDVTLTLEGNAGSGLVEVDRDRLIQVLTNLISNAVKFSPGGAAVELGVERVDSNLRFSVTDHGEGIPEEFRSKIFQKFSQADSSSTRQKGGTGLGLSISQAIVEMHGGELRFDSERGRGSTFFFELQERAGVPASPVASTDDSGLRVLICEDDPDLATLLRMLLEQEGATCDVVHDAAAVKAALGMGTSRYSALFLDLHLPGQDGLSLIRELRSHSDTRDLPIVVVSARAEEGKLELNGDAFRVVDWISKPIDVDRFKAALSLAMALSGAQTKSVLYVEDDPSLIELVPKILGAEADVSVASSLAAARALLAERSFDLVLLDLALPDGSGLELIPDLNAKQPGGIPILVLSAQELPSEYADQVSASLVKSQSSNDDLAESVRGLLSQLSREA